VEKVLRSAVRLVMEPARRLMQGDAHQWSEQTSSCPVIRGRRYPTKLTEPRVGGSPPGRRQERREQDARARECLDDAGGLELFRLPLLPDRGVAEPLGDGLLRPLLLFCGASRRRAAWTT